jgi:citrate synthase
MAETKLSTHTLEALYLRDKNLVDDVMGKMSFTDAMFYHIIGVAPSPGQRAVLDTVLVTLMEHGFTPSAIAARMTYLSAPEAMQSAVAAGLLNVASQFIGTMENAAKILAEIAEDPDGHDAACNRIVQRYRANAMHMPGFGHHLHRPDDPRTPKMFEIAMAYDDIDKRPIEILKTLGHHVDQIYGKHLTINATGATAAILMGAGIPIGIMRGFAVISRAAGLVAHIMEEQQSPTGREIWDLVDKTIPYTGNAIIKT